MNLFNTDSFHKLYYTVALINRREIDEVGNRFGNAATVPDALISFHAKDLINPFDNGQGTPYMPPDAWNVELVDDCHSFALACIAVVANYI